MFLDREWGIIATSGGLRVRCAAGEAAGYKSGVSRHSVFFDLEDALAKPGCLLCRLSTASVLQYFAALGYEQVNDIEARGELRANGGFCQRHAWLFWERSGNRLGVAIIYRDVLNHTARGLGGGGGALTGGLGRRLGRLLGGRRRSAWETPIARPCTACRYEADAERRYRSTLVEHLGAADVRERYAASDGLCLPHVKRALEAAGGRSEDLAWLRRDAARRLGGLVGELDEYIRKHDYRFRHEGFGREEDAPRRAVERAVGEERPGFSDGARLD